MGSSREAPGKLVVIPPSPSASHHHSLVNPEQIAASSSSSFSPRHTQPSVKEPRSRRGLGLLPQAGGSRDASGGAGQLPGSPRKVRVWFGNCMVCIVYRIFHLLRRRTP